MPTPSIESIIYEGYRLAYHKGEFPDGIELKSKDIANKIINYIYDEAINYRDGLLSCNVNRDIATRNLTIIYDFLNTQRITTERR